MRLAAAILCLATGLSAAEPPIPPQAPAEVVPPRAPGTPLPGHRTLEVAPPPTGSLSPGSKPPPANAPAAPPTSPVDALTEPELNQILSVLRQKLRAGTPLSELEIKRATVQGLLERLEGGAILEIGPPAAPAESPFHAERLREATGYLRLGGLNAENLAKLDAALADFAAQGVAAEVLDLRATPPGTDFALAAELSRRWAAKGRPLFSVLRRGETPEATYHAKGDPLGHGLLLVLVGPDNAGSAEIAAGALRAAAGAIVIGQPTRGQAAEMAEAPLGAGKRLRYAVAEVRLADGSPIGPRGLAPDIPVVLSGEATARVLQLESAQGIGAALVEPRRPHLTEEALVAGRNPELDAQENASRLQVSDRVPRDATLARALDLVASAAVFPPPATP